MHHWVLVNHLFYLFPIAWATKGISLCPFTGENKMKNYRDYGEKLAEQGTPRSNLIRARIRRSRPRPAGMSSGKNCPRHPKAEERLAIRLKDYEGIKNKQGFHTPGSLKVYA